MLSPLNNAFLRLQVRAESKAPDILVATFVDIGPLFVLLSGPSHQVLYGRRGTGKTHALVYLEQRRKKAGDLVANVDLRVLGSNGALYADEGSPLAQRASRLIMDSMLSVHEHLLAFFVDNAEEYNLAAAGPLLDAFTDEVSKVEVVGDVQTETNAAAEATSTEKVGGAIRASLTTFDVSDASEEGASSSLKANRSVKRSGREILRLSYGTVGAIVRQIALLLKGRRLWVLLDEWSSIPEELQPYLADFIRRCLLPVQGVTVKIAAVEQRSEFMLNKAEGGYVGVELGADLTADLNLDDYMVFENDAERAADFFAKMLFSHIKQMDEIEPATVPSTPESLIQKGFTQVNTFQEFVRAAEGVPRDAINILSIAAQRAGDALISKEHVRRGALRWYESNKRPAIKDPEAKELLHWIVDEVIGKRKARAFLLPSDQREPLIDYLFDARVLHILKRSVSSSGIAGARFDVYKLDYGCYVDLVNTAQAPQGDLEIQEDDGHVRHVDLVAVPDDDYRAIRRAVLDMDAFRNRRGLFG